MLECYIGMLPIIQVKTTKRYFTFSMQKCKKQHLQKSFACHQNGKCSSNTATTPLKKEAHNWIHTDKGIPFEDIYQLNMKWG